MRALALLRVLVGPDRAAPPAAVPRRRAARAHLPGRVLRAVRVAGTRSCREGSTSRAVARRVAARGHVDRPAAPGSRPPRVRDRHLQPLPLHHPLPQQPRLPRDRARPLAVAPCGASCRSTRGCGAARGRPPLPTTSPGWPLWLLRFESATVYGASGLSKLLDPDWFGGTVTWQRVVHVRDESTHRCCRTGRSTCSPTAPSTPAPPSSSSPPSCSSPSACGRGARATRRCGSRSASTSRSRCRPTSRCSRSSPSPCS